MPVLPIRSVLVATDLAEESDAAIRSAAAVAGRVGAELHLIHAFDLQELPTAPSGDAPTFPGRLAEAGRAVDDQVRRALEDPSAVTSRDVRIYVAHRAVLDRAAEVDADLIVLGPHRAHRVGDAFLGATADRVVRSAAAPVLVVHRALTLPLGSVLALTDFSDPSRDALDEALRWAATLGPAGGAAGVALLHVAPRAAAFTTLLTGPGLDELEARVRQEAEAARARADGRAVPLPDALVATGDFPADEILSHAERHDPGLIVIGTHGRGFLARTLLGSVASSVARRGPSPVLLVPPRTSA